MAVGITIGWITWGDWAALAFAAHEADELHKLWEQILKNYAELKKHNEEETNLIDFVSRLVKQFDGILEKIDAAVNAIGELSMLFQHQSEAYKIISGSISKIKASTTVADATLRKDFIMFSIDLTVKKIQEVSSHFLNGDVFPGFD